MSGKVVGWAMEQRTGSPATKLVLAKLADNAGEDGLCWPSIELLIEHTELGQSTVYKHLAALELLQLIKPIEIVVQGDPKKGFQLAVPGADVSIPPGGIVEITIPPRGKPREVVPSAGKISPRHGKKIPRGGTPYKEEPSAEPSMNRYSPAPDGAESGKIASLNRGATERWPEFRSAVANSWPSGFPAENETACKAEFERQTRLNSPEIVIGCALAHGTKKTAENAGRTKALGPIQMRKPSNWLKDGDWQGYIPQVERERSVETGVALALAAVRTALGDDVFDRLRRCVSSDGELAKFDGLLFEDGNFIATPFQASLLRRHQGRLAQEFKEFEQVVVVERRSA